MFLTPPLLTVFDLGYKPYCRIALSALYIRCSDRPSEQKVILIHEDSTHRIFSIMQQ